MKRSQLSTTLLNRSRLRQRSWGASPAALSMLQDSMMLLPRRTAVQPFSRSYSTRGGGNRQQAPDLAAITELSQELTKLREKYPRASASPTLPFLWEPQENPMIVQRRDELLQDVSRVVELLKRRIQNGVIRPDRKYRREVSVIEERLLKQLQLCVMDGRQDVYPIVCEILNLMQQFQMEILLAHCEPAMYIAAREGHWAEASKLFQIPLDMGSMEIPNDPTMGLYCIAKHDQDIGALPVESVFEAVAKLTSKSSDGSEKHVLAAGVALGHVGEWEATRDYLKTSYIANQFGQVRSVLDQKNHTIYSTFGQPLVAAAMEACVLANQPEKAIDLFNELVAGELAAAAEWQWSGTSKKIHPACRDVAIRAIGDLVDPIEEAERMIVLYQQAETEGMSISIEANHAVLRTFGKIGMVEESVTFFTSLLDKEPKRWLVSSTELFITDTKTMSSMSHEEIDMLLLEIMESCNRHKRFGLSLLCLKLFQFSSPAVELHDYSNEDSPIVRSLLPSFSDLEGCDRLLAATMTSLCGVHAPQEAIALYDLLTRNFQDGAAKNCCHIRKYAKSMQQVIDPTLVHSWSYVHRHIDRLTAAIVNLEKSQQAMEAEDLKILSNALATAVADCTAASTPETGLAIGAWVDNRKLNISHANGDNPIIFSNAEKNSVLPLSDALLAATIGAYRAYGKSETAESLVKSLLFGTRSPTDWLLSYQEAVEILYSNGETAKATALFRKILAFRKSPGFFVVAARGLVHSGDWRGVVEIYKLALSSGCSTEDLSLLAMESVAASGRLGQKEGQLPFLRSIILDVAKQSGITPKDWVETNYWKLRRLLGFSTARLIMGWDDPRTSRLDELELALENLEERSSSGLTPKHTVLYAILKAVANHDAVEIPFNRTGLPRIPRRFDAWARVFDKVMKEAESTMIVNEPRFIDASANASFRLGLHEKCFAVVSDAIERGIRVNKTALQCANDSAVTLEISNQTSDMRFLLADDVS